MNYYEALYGKCKDCRISTITLPGPEIRHYPVKDLEVYEQDVLEIGKEKNTYINMWPRKNEILDDVRGEAGDVTYATCFFADYDVKGEAHKQENLPESKEEVIAYLKALPVAPTFIVDTGYGIDPIWCFKEPVLLDSDEIKKKAGNMLAGFGNYLIAEGRTKGWNIDNVFDAARMLRAPGSYNCKLGNKVECRIIFESGIFYAMEDFAEYCIEVHTEVSESFEVDGRVVGSAERIMENCLAMQKLLSDPNGVNEQLWYALCTNVVLGKDGEEKFQEWSSPYLGYSHEETARKIKHAQEQQKPCTCYYIKERLGFQCPEGGCGVKSPVVFSLYSKEEQLTNLLMELNAKERVDIDEVVDPYVLKLMVYAKDHCPIAYAKFKPIVKKSGIGMREFNKIIKIEEEKLQELSFDMVPMEIILEGIDLNAAMAPKGYYVSIKNGVEIFHSEDGQMEPRCLCDEPLVISRRLENIDNGTEKFELSFYRNGRWKKLIVPRSNALNKNVLIRYADNGISVSSINAEGLVNYLSVYESTNDKQIPFVRSINRIGWLGKEFYPCVVKDEIIFEDNEASEILSAICEHGSFEEWLATANKLRQSIFARAIMAASFASPLLELLQHRVIILHLWHSSRSGKTAILKFALSVWGDPLKLMGNFNSTAVGLERRAGTLKHLPLGLDELQVLNEKRLSASLIVYSLGNGYGKTRGAKNGGLQDVPTWRNCIISTGEQPLSNENSMDGINSRV
ncbi:MAG: DUF927 domain-containing protein, partial [Lachnospiraceae bacterium]|nr:DUF927 domain-containing protein [Lachnospiraceae bacterium]